MSKCNVFDLIHYFFGGVIRSNESSWHLGSFYATNYGLNWLKLIYGWSNWTVIEILLRSTFQVNSLDSFFLLIRHEHPVSNFIQFIQFKLIYRIICHSAPINVVANDKNYIIDYLISNLIKANVIAQKCETSVFQHLH